MEVFKKKYGNSLKNTLFSIAGLFFLPLLLLAAPLKKNHGERRGDVAFLQRSRESGSRVSMQHGLIVAKENLSGSVNWTDAYGACEQLEENGFNDWHLPDKDELNRVCLSRALIGGFSDDRYWSSTEYDQKSAFSQQFLNGLQEVVPKTELLMVRPVRTF